MNLGLYLTMVRDSETELAEALHTVAVHHRDEPDIEAICHLLAAWSRHKAESTARFLKRYGGGHDRSAQQLSATLFHGPRRGGLSLLRDLHDLWLLATEAQICWTLLGQAAQGLRDNELLDVCDHNRNQTARQVAWLETRSKQAAPQTLIAA